jgi:VWFA-related protein
MAARPRVPIAALSVALCWLAMPPGLAQAPVFRSSVDTVRLDVSVTRSGAPVTGLAAGQFEVRDNSVPQKVELVAREDVPLRLLLALDTSSSLAGDRLDALTDAARGLVRALRPEDEAGLLTFSQVLDVAVPPSTAHDDVLDALERLEASGPTAWRDALFTGLQLSGPSDTHRAVVLLFSDGADTSSWMAPDGIAETVCRSGVVVHAVVLAGGMTAADRHGRRIGDLGLSRSLQQAVDAGGGRVWEADNPGKLRSLFTTALDELRARYQLVYTPSEAPAPGWHEVKVRVTEVRADVTARPGYYVPPR